MPDEILDFASYGNGWFYIMSQLAGIDHRIDQDLYLEQAHYKVCQQTIGAEYPVKSVGDGMLRAIRMFEEKRKEMEV